MRTHVQLIGKNLCNFQFDIYSQTDVRRVEQLIK